MNLRPTRRSVGWTAVSVLTIGAMLSIGAAAGAKDDEAKALIRDSGGSVIGVARLEQKRDGVHFKVSVNAPLTTVTAGFHGFHVHALGVCTPPDFTSAGGHYNPAGAAHGAHAGDLPILLVNSDGSGKGYAAARFVTRSFAIADVLGRALVIHAMSDNFGNIPIGSGPTQYTPNTTGTTNDTATGLTANTGNAGARIGCGEILSEYDDD